MKINCKASKSPSSRDSLKNLSPRYTNDSKSKKFEKSFESKNYIECQIELLLKVIKINKFYFIMLKRKQKMVIKMKLFPFWILLLT